MNVYRTSLLFSSPLFCFFTHVQIRVQRSDDGYHRRKETNQVSSKNGNFFFFFSSIYPSILHKFCCIGGNGSDARVVVINGVQRSSILSFRSKVLMRIDVLCAFLSPVLFHIFFPLLILSFSFLLYRPFVVLSLSRSSCHNERNTKMVPLFLQR